MSVKDKSNETNSIVKAHLFGLRKRNWSNFTSYNPIQLCFWKPTKTGHVWQETVDEERNKKNHGKKSRRQPFGYPELTDQWNNKDFFRKFRPLLVDLTCLSTSRKATDCNHYQPCPISRTMDALLCLHSIFLPSPTQPPAPLHTVTPKHTRSRSRGLVLPSKVMRPFDVLTVDLNLISRSGTSMWGRYLTYLGFSSRNGRMDVNISKEAWQTPPSKGRRWKD